MDYLQAEGDGHLRVCSTLRFDIVAFDPARSGAEHTGDRLPGVDKETEGKPVPTARARRRSPWTPMRSWPAPRATSTPVWRTTARSCEHVSTANVARDMDALRAAVGDERLSYLGFSYGTFLGATYAALFPDRYRALAAPRGGGSGGLDPRPRLPLAPPSSSRSRARSTGSSPPAQPTRPPAPGSAAAIPPPPTTRCLSSAAADADPRAPVHGGPPAGDRRRHQRSSRANCCTRSRCGASWLPRSPRPTPGDGSIFRASMRPWWAPRRCHAGLDRFFSIAASEQQAAARRRRLPGARRA